MPEPHVLFIGRTTVDAVYWLDRIPEEDTKVFARAFRAAPGGPACNAAITCALLGGNATLLSAVGAGPFARLVRDELERHGIRLIDRADGTKYETPLTAALVSAANSTRTIVNPPAEAAPFDSIGPEWDPRWGEPPQVALTDGFHIAETLPLLRACHDAGCLLVLDGGSWKPGTEELSPLLTAAVCSERFRAPGLAPDPGETLRWFAGHGVPYVAVTRGPRSILGLEHGRPFEIEISPIAAVDTLGAGDVLHGAFGYFFALTGDFEACLRRAAEVATRSCQGMGISA
jgi:sugar/nucleoside kinase (ribokinase family)